MGLKNYIPTDPAVDTQKDLTYTFPEDGKYRVYLKAWDSANPSCFASYSSIVKVNCGIDARFFPDKRIIASKRTSAKFLDNVTFTNRSNGATDYEWTITHTLLDPSKGTQLPDFTSNDEHITHTFLEPGTYNISLRASAGACADTTETYTLRVEDPTMNGVPLITQAHCLGEDSLKVLFTVLNSGYDTLNVGAPISFYDADPHQAAPLPNLLHTFYLPEAIYGRDENIPIFEVDFAAADTSRKSLFAAFNDGGDDFAPLTFPLTWPEADQNVTSDLSEFPPSGQNELTYLDNVRAIVDFQFGLQVDVPNPVVCANSQYQFEAEVRNEYGPTTVEWIPADGLSCSDCLNPVVDIGTADFERQLIVTSGLNCTDTATVRFTVNPETLAPVVSPPLEICQNTTPPDLATLVQGNNLQWYTQETGGTADLNVPTIDTATPNNYEFWISRIDNGCEGPREKLSITVHPDSPPAVTAVTDACIGDATPDLANFVTGTNLLWYSSETGGTGNINPPVFSTGNPITYTVWVSQTVGSCESARSMVTFTVLEETPVPQVSGPVNICLGDAIPDDQSFVTGSNLRWYADERLQSPLSGSPQFNTSALDTLQFWVTQTVNGCEGEATEVTFQMNQITLESQGPYEIDEGESIELRVVADLIPDIGMPNFIWRDQDGNQVGTGDTLTVSPTDPTFYTVEAETPAGCLAMLDVPVNVIKALKPAAIFTPNGDGFNDLWEIGFVNQFPNAQVTIFSRWGRQVYQSTQYQNDWNGRLNNEPLPIGTYYFVVDLSAYNRKSVTGSVTIMR